jgi:hypothetical protein
MRVQQTPRTDAPSDSLANVAIQKRQQIENHQKDNIRNEAIAIAHQSIRHKVKPTDQRPLQKTIQKDRREAQPLPKDIGAIRSIRVEQIPQQNQTQNLTLLQTTETSAQTSRDRITTQYQGV